MNKIFLTALLLAVVGLGYYGYNQFGYKQTLDDNDGDSGDRVACTMEALICPDGSSIGRSGPKCEFSACPNQSSFIGELRQQGQDYFLIIPAPQGMPGEVTYSIPLRITSTKYILSDLIARQFRVTGKFLTGNTLAVETIEPVVPEQNKAELRVGETKFVNGVRVTLKSIVEDSRCPGDVQCIQAGRLVVSVTLKSDTDQETLNLASDGAPKGFDIFKVSITDATPYPMAGLTIAPGDYKVTFKITK